MMGLWTSLLMHLWRLVAGGRKRSVTSSSSAAAAERPSPTPTQRSASKVLFILARAGDVLGVERLLARGADPNSTVDGGWAPWGAYSPGTTALMVACEMNSLKCMKVVRMLLTAGADPNAANSEGNTALMVAAGIGQEAVLALLLAAGADPNLSNANGTTAVTLASKFGHAAVVSKLLAAGANANDARNRHWPALLAAARAGHLDVLSVLLSAGAEANKARADGVTALMVASGHGHAAVVAALLAAGADPNRFGPFGWTAVMAAMSGGHEEVVSALLAAGAEPAARSLARYWAGVLKRIQGMLLTPLTYLTSRVQRPAQDPKAMEAAAVQPAAAAADAVAAKLITDEEADEAKVSGGNKKDTKQQAEKVKVNKSTQQEGTAATVLAPGLLELAVTAEEPAAGPPSEMPEELIDFSQAQGLPSDHHDAGLSAVAGELSAVEGATRKVPPSGTMCMPPTSHPAPLAPEPRPTRSCSCCGLTGSSMQKCAGCLVARYCSPQCQRKDWREGGHKAACAGLKAQRGG